MPDTQRELDRVLTLLRNKIRERGFTQLEVQEALSWGRSYISQLLTKQKSLRVEQVLLILGVIGVSPQEFFGELYNIGPAAVQAGEYAAPMPGRAPYNVSAVAEMADREGFAGDFVRSFREVRSLLRGLLRLMVDKKVIAVEELDAAVRSAEGAAIMGNLEGE